MKDDKNKKHNSGTGKKTPRPPVTPRIKDEEREKRFRETIEEIANRYSKAFEKLA